MNNDEGIPMRKTAILVICLVGAIASCGGGSDADDVLFPGLTPDGTDTEIVKSRQVDCPALSSAYDRISKGMMPEEVKAIVECEPYLQSELNGIIASISFVDSKLQNEGLGIVFDYVTTTHKQQGGVISKVYINSQTGLSKLDNFY